MRVIPPRERYNYVDRPCLLTCIEEKSRDNGSPTRASALHTVYHPSTGKLLQIAAPQIKLLHPSAQAARSWHRSPPHGVPDTGNPKVQPGTEKAIRKQPCPALLGMSMKFRQNTLLTYTRSLVILCPSIMPNFLQESW